MLEAIIFDMDGLLIDSEPLWQEAEKKIFKNVWITLDDKQVTETTGLRVDEVVEYWFQRFPWDTDFYSKQQLDKDVVEEVKNLIREKWEAKEGVDKILPLLWSKNIPMAIASSSEYSIIHTVVEKIWIGEFFQLIYSAEEEQYGKPHPAVYISTCIKLWVNPEKTIAFEDSFNGVLSAKSAKIKCIAVPEEVNKDNKKFIIADMILDSLEKFWEEEWNKLEANTKKD